MSISEVYEHPHYYDLGYRFNTPSECDFIEACLKAHGPETTSRLLDIGCGSGRHLIELARRGYDVEGIDSSDAMIIYLQKKAQQEEVDVTAYVEDMRHMNVEGPYDGAICFMDTFRNLLTNEEIIAHLKEVGKRLVTGGLYIIDFWVPRQYDQIGSEIHQWEQEDDETKMRVFYVQHPDSIDPVAQTFEDELIFEIIENGQKEEIRGGRTRTRLLMPQEFASLVAASGIFDLVGKYAEFDLNKPLDSQTLSWRMITLLKKREAAPFDL